MLEDDTRFLQQDITYGVILLGTLEQIQRFKQLVLQENFKIVYQKTSLNKLIIIEGSNNDNK